MTDLPAEAGSFSLIRYSSPVRPHAWLGDKPSAAEMLVPAPAAWPAVPPWPALPATLLIGAQTDPKRTFAPDHPVEAVQQRNGCDMHFPVGSVVPAEPEDRP